MSGALFSNNGAYRYRLWRVLGPEPRRVLFVMLNPSTADAHYDDPTIRRCLGFARREGCGRLDVVNLYALCSSSPAELRYVDDPVGPDNDKHIRDALAETDLVVCAWGAERGPDWYRPRRVAELLLAAGPTFCLGRTMGGAPRHPLYLRADAELVPWSQP